MNEVRIEFDQLIFEDEILNYFKNSANVHGLTLNKGDNFILTMNWAWRAPDNENFTSILPIDAMSVLILNQASDTSRSANPTSENTRNTTFINKNTQTVTFTDDEKLRIRTKAYGESTITFSLVYVDKIFRSPFFITIFKTLGGLLLAKATGGMGEVFKKVLTAVGNNTLEEITKLEDNDVYALGIGKLKYDDSVGEDNKLDLINKDGAKIAELELTIKK